MSVAGAVDRGCAVAPRTWPEDPLGDGPGVSFEDGAALGDELGTELGEELGTELGEELGTELGEELGGVLGLGDGQAGTVTLLISNPSENVIR